MNKLSSCLILAVVGCSSFGQLLSIDKPTFTFGEMDDISRVSRDVILSNSGDKVLKIEKVKGTCGCTAAKPAKEELAPGEETVVTISFTPVGLSGEVKKTVKVTTNDIERRVKLITFTANIHPILLFTPTGFISDYNEETGKFASLEEELRIVNQGQKTIEIIKLEINKNGVPVQIEGPAKVIFEPGHEEVYKVTVDTEELSDRPPRTWIIVRTKFGRTYSARNVHIRFKRNNKFVVPSYRK